jgi:hypothetical protein
LATHVTTLAYIPDGCWADRVIVAALIQHGRLFPNCIGQPWPAQILPTPLRVYGSEER